ncbi:MAG: lysostaphin resistance A-like protein [Gemmatimonadota bacterium]
MNVRTRAGLCLAAWLIATVVALALAGGLIGAVGLGSLTGYAILDALLLAVSFACWRWLEGRRPGETPLAVDRRAARALLRGAATGASLVGLAVAVLALAGAYDLAPRACRAEPLLRFAAGTAAFVALASLFEEALFRGYGLFALRDLAGPSAAVIATGLVFAVGHQANPGFGWMAVINLALVGAVLAGWILVEGDVWVAVGAHAGWNGAIVLGAAIPISGMAIPAPCHTGILQGPYWITGGTFGIEAGLPTAAVWLGLGMWLWRGRSRSGLRGGAEN